MSIGSRCESDEWKLEHDYRSLSFDTGGSAAEDMPPELFMIKHKHLSLLPAKNNAILVVPSNPSLLLLSTQILRVNIMFLYFLFKLKRVTIAYSTITLF